jgi:hypothetical protein
MSNLIRPTPAVSRRAKPARMHRVVRRIYHLFTTKDFMLHVLVNIGCIECGVSTQIVGIFNDVAKADDLASKLNDSQEYSWREGGQNRYEVFPVKELDVIHPDYLSVLVDPPNPQDQRADAPEKP